MNLSRLTAQSPPKKNQNYQLGDEKSKILNDRSPEKTRKESSPPPKIRSEKESKAKEISDKSIYEYKNFGTGKIDLLSCRFSPDDSLIASASSDGIINIYAVQEPAEKPLVTLNGANLPGTPVTCLRWKPATYSHNPQILISSCSDGNLSQWYVPTGKLLSRITEEDNEILACDYSKDGTYFATAGKDRAIRVYDDKTKSMITKLSGGFGQYPGHSNRILALKFHQTDPNLIISGGWDHNVYFWDIRQERSYGTIQGPTVSGDALDMKNNLVLTGSWRNKEQLELWDYGMRKKVQNIDWEYGKSVSNSYIYSCQFSKADDESILAGCSTINEVRVFDRANDYRDFGRVTDMVKGVYCVDYANNSNLFSFCGGEGRVHLIQITKNQNIKLI